MSRGSHRAPRGLLTCAPPWTSSRCTHRPFSAAPANLAPPVRPANGRRLQLPGISPALHLAVEGEPGPSSPSPPPAAESHPDLPAYGHPPAVEGGSRSVQPLVAPAGRAESTQVCLCLHGASWESHRHCLKQGLIRKELAVSLCCLPTHRHSASQLFFHFFHQDL